MCGRYNLITDPIAWLTAFAILMDVELPPWLPRHNIAPGQSAPILYGSRPTCLSLMEWGLVPGWLKDTPKSRPINAKAETLVEKPYFRDAFRHRRCLVPATGFYEWHAAEGGKIPYHVRRTDHQPFLMAGLWDGWSQPDGGIRPTFAIITTTANRTVSSIHDRMPVILALDDWQTWVADDKAATRLLTPCPPDWLTIERISPKVNNPRNDSPDMLDPMPPNARR